MSSIKVGDVLEVGNKNYPVDAVNNGRAVITDDNMVGRIKLEDIEYYDDAQWSGETGHHCDEWDVDWKYNFATQIVLDMSATPVKNVYQYNSVESLKKLLHIFKNHSILGFRGKDDLLVSLSKDYGLIFVWHEWDGEYDCEYPYLKVIQGAKVVKGI